MTVQLWRNLSRTEHRDLSRRFMAFAPEAIGSLNPEEFFLFSQWLYGRQYGHMALVVVECQGGAEFEIEASYKTREVLRVYPGGIIPYAMLYELLQPRVGQVPQKLRVYMQAAATPAIKRLHEQFPLAFEAVDGMGLRLRLADEQRRYRPVTKRPQSSIARLISKLKGK